MDEAANGNQAIKQYEQNMLKGCDKPNCNAYYKLIIMDIAMPEKDGFEASKEILQIQNSVRDIAVSDNNLEDGNQICDIVALTSFSDKTTYDTCMQIGVREVLNKPIHHQELLRIVLIYFFKLNRDQYKYYLKIEPQDGFAI